MSMFGITITSIQDAVTRLKNVKDDLEKIIENPQLLRNTYEHKLEGKQVHIVIHQPKIL